MAHGHPLDINPPNATYHLTNGGSDWLWAAFAIFVVTLLGVAGWTFSRPRGSRLFHQIAIVVLTTGSLAYFSMASDLGATPVRVEFRGDGTRQIWYVRYINWCITLPLLLLELLLATGLSLSDIFTTLFMSIVLVVSGLVGALVQTRYKWGYYVFGVVALFYIWHVLLRHGPRTTFAAGGAVRSGYRLASGYLSLLLLLYPIAWACSEGSNIISVTSEMIWYGILDILAGPVFLVFFLWELRGADYNAFGLQSGKYTDKSGFVPTAPGATRVAPGTAAPATAAPATTTGAAGRV